MNNIKELGKTSVGLQANVAGLLCYILGWITGLVFLLIEKENKFVKFHAVQSIIVFATLSLIMAILPLIPVLGSVLMIVIPMLSFALWLILIIKAYQGECFKLPIAGDIAEKKAKT